MNINSSNSLYGVSAYSNSSSSAMSSMATKFAEELLTSMDSDSSGSVDSAEFSSAALALSSSDDTSAVKEAFSALDTNEDGVVSIDELTSSIEAIIGQQGTMAAGGPPPPPPPSKEEDTGYTQEELTAMSSEVASNDSKLSSLFETLAKNFNSADTNGDGKVTSAEAMAYEESTKQTSVGTTTASDSGDGLMKKLMEQIIAQYATQNSISTSAINLSA